MKTVSVEYTPEESKKETGEAAELQEPLYPYGLSLYLDKETLEKLGLDAATLTVGTIVEIAGKARVTGYSEREYRGGVNKYSDLQITELGVAKGATEAEPGKTVYPGMA